MPSGHHPAAEYQHEVGLTCSCSSLLSQSWWGASGRCLSSRWAKVRSTACCRCGPWPRREGKMKESNPLNHGVGAKQCMGLLNQSRAWAGELEADELEAGGKTWTRATVRRDARRDTSLEQAKGVDWATSRRANWIQSFEIDIDIEGSHQCTAVHCASAMSRVRPAQPMFAE